jgi:tol-pal system protein YbgF
VPTPDQLYQASLQELRRGSLGAARTGFREFLKTYPTHAQVPDALYFVGETFAVDQPDSAASYYREVAERYPASERAPTALYKTGLAAERAGNRAGARPIYEQVIQRYPRSREADLARDRMANLRP